MVSVTIGLGSNCGDRKALISEAISWLRKILSQTSASEIYETPCALKEGRPYMNAVVEGFYQGTGIELNELLKEKEHEMGRDKKCREQGLVPIDIDLVICNGEILKPWDFNQKFFKIGYSEIKAHQK